MSTQGEMKMTNVVSFTQASLEERCRHVKTRIAEGDKATATAEEHYKAAGAELKKLKAEYASTWKEWETLLKTKIGIGKTRASELMAIADGRKTVEQVRASGAEREAARRKRATSPSRDGEESGKTSSFPRGKDDSDKKKKRRPLKGASAKIFRYFEKHSPTTADDAEAKLKLPHQTVSARVADLRKSGHLVGIGKRAETRTGSSAELLIANANPEPTKPSADEQDKAITKAMAALVNAVKGKNHQQIANVVCDLLEACKVSEVLVSKEAQRRRRKRGQHDITLMSF